MERPIEATITSVEPRAFMAQPSAMPSRQDSRPIIAPTKAPENFPIEAMATRAAVSAARCQILEDGEIGGQARHAEEDGHEEGGDHAAQLGLDMAGEDGRFPDQHARHEGAQHGAHAQKLGDPRQARP